MNKKAIIALGLTASTIFSGLVARQVIGSQAADRCQTAVDSYSLLVEAQIGEMNSAKNMIEMIKENPFAAFMVGGDLAKITSEAEGNFNEINKAGEIADGTCNNGGLMGAITESYTAPITEEFYSVSQDLEDTRVALVDATKVEAPSGPVARINGKTFKFTRMNEATWVVHNVNGESLTYQIGAPLYLGNGSVLITDGDGATSGGTFQFTEGSGSFTITTDRGNEIVIDLG